MKVFKMIREFFLKRSRSYKIMQNVIFHVKLLLTPTLRGVPSIKKESVGQIKAVMTDFDLIDIWRARNPTYRKFSWTRSKPVTLRRLDYFLVSSHMELDIASCAFYTPIQSDHSPIFLKISPLADVFSGPGYWKFSNSLVSDPIYTERNKRINF